MELTLSSSLRVNLNLHVKSNYSFGNNKSRFMPVKPSIVRLPNRDLFSFGSSKAIASLKVLGQTTSAAASRYEIAFKMSIESIAKAKFKASYEYEEEFDSSTGIDSETSNDDSTEVDSDKSEYYDSSNEVDPVDEPDNSTEEKVDSDASDDDVDDDECDSSTEEADSDASECDSSTEEADPDTSECDSSTEEVDSDVTDDDESDECDFSSEEVDSDASDDSDDESDSSTEEVDSKASHDDGDECNSSTEEVDADAYDDTDSSMEEEVDLHVSDDDSAGENETRNFDTGTLTHDRKTFHEKLSLTKDLIKLRVQAMVKWFLRLSRVPEFMKETCLSKKSQIFLIKLADEVTGRDCMAIMKIMAENEKDGVEAAKSFYYKSAKAVETFLKEKCKSDPDITKLIEFFKVQSRGSRNFDMGNLSHNDDITFHERVYSLTGDYNLIRLRAQVMVKWFLRLSRVPEFMKVTCLSKESQIFLIKLAEEVTEKDVTEINKIMTAVEEKDGGIKAVETFLKEKCKSDPDMVKMIDFFNLANTSSEIQDLIVALMVQETKKLIILPVINCLMDDIRCLAENSARIPIGGTHDSRELQTTMGMEVAKFAQRLDEAHKEIAEVEILGPFDINHIEGKWNIDLEDIGKEFVRFLGISPSLDHEAKHYEYIDTFLHSIMRFNGILVEFDREILKEISTNFGYNIGITNGWLYDLTEMFPLERTSHYFMRRMGFYLKRSLFAYLDIQIGIRTANIEVLEASSKVNNLINSLAKTVLEVMQMYEFPSDSESYKKLEGFRKNGKLGNQEIITEFIEGLEIPSSTKTSLMNITLPHTCDNGFDDEKLEKIRSGDLEWCSLPYWMGI